jgi:hypothetical protein
LPVTEDKWWGPAVSDYNLTEVAIKETHKLFDDSEGKFRNFDGNQGSAIIFSGSERIVSNIIGRLFF